MLSKDMSDNKKSLILEQLARNQILGEDYVDVDGWIVKFKNNKLFCDGLYDTAFKNKTLEDFNIDKCLLEYLNGEQLKTIDNFYILELDYHDLPFEYCDSSSIYRDISELRKILDSTIFVLVLRNFKEYKNYFGFDGLFDIIYSPETESIIDSFNYTFGSLNRILVLPNLVSKLNSIETFIKSNLFVYLPEYEFKYQRNFYEHVKTHYNVEFGCYSSKRLSEKEFYTLVNAINKLGECLCI